MQKCRDCLFYLDPIFDGGHGVALLDLHEEGAAPGGEGLLAEVGHRDEQLALVNLLLIPGHLLQTVSLAAVALNKD